MSKAEELKLGILTASSKISMSAADCSDSDSDGDECGDCGDDCLGCAG